MKEEIRYMSADGRSTVFGSVWHSVGRAPLGVVQISHGMCEYTDRYADLAQHLVSRGFVVCGNDHLGHGRSAQGTGLGYFAHTGGWCYVMEDMFKLTSLMKRRYPMLPYFLFGHSMGSMLSRVYATRYGDMLDGLVLSGTLGPQAGLPGATALAALRRRGKGEFYPDKMLEDLTFRGYNRRCKPQRTERDWLCTDEQVVDAYLADPWCNFTFTTSAFLDMYQLTAQVSAPDSAIQIPKHLPVLLYSGCEDPVGDYGKGVRMVYSRIRNAGVSDVTLRLYEDMRHEPHNEPGKLEVYNDLTDWLFAHI